MQAYRAYYEKGRFIPVIPMVEIMNIPEGAQAIVTVLDDETLKKDYKFKSEHAEAWREFLEDIKNIDDESVPEFERVKFREIDI